MRRDLLLLAALAVLIRLPFLAQPVQGDDVYYLLIARNALADPLHPMQTSFRYMGEIVWAAGHTRPPLNAYTLAGLLAVFGRVHEVGFHLFYLLFSLAAVFAMYFLARHYSDKPLLATFVFAAVPAFVVNGNKLEADLPLLAFWLTAFALFVHQRFRPAAIVMGVAGLWAYQTVFAVPILAWFAWQRHRRHVTAWTAVLTAPAVLAVWQLWEQATAGVAPAAVLASHFETYNMLALDRKVRSGLALVAHLGMMLSPLLVIAACCRPAGRSRPGWVLAVLACFGALLPALLVDNYTPAQRVFLWFSFALGLLLLLDSLLLVFQRPREPEGNLAVWLLLYFAAAVAVFYAGSARYLLPLAAPLVLLIVRRVDSKALLLGATALQLVVALALAQTEYHYAQRCRDLAQQAASLSQNRRLWTNAEWGLRHYLEQHGAEMLLRDQPVHRGAVVVTSELAPGVPFQAAGVLLTKLFAAAIEPGPLGLRVIGLGSRSGYSSSEFGILPFDFHPGPIDRIAAFGVGMTEPTSGYLTMNSPEAEQQLLSGFYQLETGRWRWTSREAIALLRMPSEAEVFVLHFFIPEAAPARRVNVQLDSTPLASETYPSAGNYTLRAQLPAANVALPPAGQSVQVRISVDETLQTPADNRELGIVVTEFGFVSAK